MHVHILFRAQERDNRGNLPGRAKTLQGNQGENFILREVPRHLRIDDPGSDNIHQDILPGNLTRERLCRVVRRLPL